jgi:hypothetical protein
MTAPKLNRGQVSLLCCDINTGHVLRTDGQVYTQTGDVYQIFDSLESAEKFISISLPDSPGVEFVVYGHDGKPLISWNKFEKKKFQ